MKPVRSIRIDALTEIESPPYLVKGFLTAGATSTIYGPPKSRKSFVMLDLAAHIALGLPWCGRKVLQGPVVYVVAEGWHSINNRVEAFFQHHSLERTGVPLYVMQPVRLGGKVDDDAEAIVAEIKRQEIEPVLIVLDTLNRTMVGDENSTADMTAYVRRVDYLRSKTGAHVCIIHHVGKDTARGARGSSALKGAVDTECPIDRADDLTVIGPPLQRDLPEDFRQSFEGKIVEVGLDEDAEAVTSLVLTPTDREPPPSEKKISERTQKALNLLWDEIKAGRGVSGGAGGPPIDDRLHAIREDDWRSLCNDLPLTTSPNRTAVNKAFRDVKAQLLEARKVGAGDGWVWPWPTGGGGDDEILF